jgi:alcohol dehydrogenase class IV
MVKPFIFARSPRIIFGFGNIAELPGIAKAYGNDILLVIGKSSFINSKYGEYLTHTFEMTGIRYHKVIVNREPSPEMIDQAVIGNQSKKIGLVIAVGGGSVIDAGKAISAMLGKGESIMNYLEGVGNKEHPGSKIPFIAVPTTSGTGSEATKNAVISHIGPNGFKRSLRHDNFMPDYAIVDPELTLHCPPDITAYSGMDCFTQLVEAYVSGKANVITDALALDGLKYIKQSLLRAYRLGQDIEARTGMSYAALISGITLANANLGAVHGFASSVGGLFSVPHGVVCGTLMGITNRVTVNKLKQNGNNNGSLEKYATLGKLFAEKENKTEEWYVDAFLGIIDKWTEMLAIPKLSEFGIKRADISKIAACTDSKSNPIKLTSDDYIAILENRI